MICYHTTDAADEILAGGFADATGSYLLVGMELTGVWLADKPLGGNEGANGDQVQTWSMDGGDLVIERGQNKTYYKKG